MASLWLDIVSDLMMVFLIPRLDVEIHDRLANVV